jgi:hypothetical protein
MVVVTIKSAKCFTVPIFFLLLIFEVCNKKRP